MIESLSFKDAKVYVSNVDSQASAAGGIIIQVLGEMSNAGGNWRKFVQTFFLGEQPNGYFVLNDIFRYLKEEGEMEEEAIEIDEAIKDEVQEAESKGEEVVHQVEVQSESVPGSVIVGTTQIDASTDTTVPATRLQDAQVNGVFKHQEPTPAEPAQVGMDKKVTSSAAEVPATGGATEAAEAASTASNANAATPGLNGGAAAPSAPAPAALSAPKTWANMVASNATKWAPTVASESRGISSSVKDTAAAAPPSSKSSAAVISSSQQQQQQASKSHGGPGSVFIKNIIVDQLPPQGLQAALEAKFGPLKECQVIPSKACAFAEFSSVESAKKAIQMSLPVSQGGEGGVKVGPNGWTVIVEEKRRPNDRPQAGAASRGGARGGAAGGGAPVTRGARGGGRGGGSGGRGGRGGA